MIWACVWLPRTCRGQIEVDAYISNFGGSDVSVINTTSNNTVIGSPIPVGDFPTGVAITPDGRFAYITNENPVGTVSVINAADKTVFPGSIPVGPFPIGVAVTPNAQFAYVANANDTVSVIDVATNAAATVTVPVGTGTVPFGVAVTPDGRFAYVTDSGTNTVSVIATATNTVVGSQIPVGNFPEGVAITPDGKFAYVTNFGDGTVSVINRATNAVTTILVGGAPEGIAITPNGNFVFVANQSGNTVSVINRLTNQVVSIPVGTTPVGVDITPDGRFAYVTNSGNNTVSVIKVGSNSVFQTINVGNEPGSFGAFIGPNLIVAAGGPLLVANDSALTPLGFGTFVDFNGGTLRTSGSLVTSRTISLLMLGGTIDTNGFDSILSGGIINSGSLTKIGAGTLTLSGNNSYSGGTNILDGVLSVSSDANLGTGNLVLGNRAELLTTGTSFSSGKTIVLGNGGGTLASASGSMATYGGVISGGGPLNIGDAINDGTIVLSGANTYTGGTEISDGTLVANSAQALGLGDVVVQGGVLRTDLQSINVKGNYTQTASGVLQLGLGGTAPGQSELLNVGGHADLGGTLQLISLNGFQPKFGDKLTLVLAAGGVSGKFADLLDPFSPLIALDLVYGPDSVVLEFASDFAAFAQTPNQLAVAEQLDRVALDPREAQLISFLQNQPLGDLAADFEKISPDGLSAIYEISFSAANVQAANLENRFAELRDGSTGFTSSLNLSNSPGTMTESKDGKAVIEPGKNVLTPSPENQWGVWISGSGDFVNVSGGGYDFTTGGVSLGLDYRLTRNFVVGISASYAHTDTNLSGDGSIDVNSGRAGIYATFYTGGSSEGREGERTFYLNGYLGGGYNSYGTRRDALAGIASGSTEGGEFNALLGAGYELRFGSLSFGPIASFQYAAVDFSSFNESGSLAPLRIDSNSEDSLRTNLGLSASYHWKFGHLQIIPNVRASWQHEFSYRALPIDAQFASGAGSIFTVHGPELGADSALIEAGLNVQWTPAIGTYFGYDGQLGRSNYDSHAVICSVYLDF
jgi:autotransporter-associated beta strand protein/YVTN family beta-propeller protein